MQQSSARPAYSRVSVKSQTVIPREVRDLLGLKPGDMLRYRFSEGRVLIDKAPTQGMNDPFVTFPEWADDADEEAYATL